MADVTPLSVHRPDGTPKGGVIVVQEAFGVNEHIDDIGRRLAAEGWLAVIPHVFHRTGDPTFGYDDISVVMPHMQALKADEILDDIDAALAALDAEGVDAAHTGIVGFCMGGTIALVVATRRPIGAAVTFYGGGVSTGRFGFPPLVDIAGDITVPWLGLFGDADQGIPVEDVEQLRKNAAAATAETEIVRYPDAPHGFNCDRRDSYRPEAAGDAWARTLAWFDRHLASS
jgi:carboxymethylenebutenolidase